MSDLKFKRNESFYIRDGWFQKAIHGIHNSQENIFSGTRGVDELGIGSNMVKGLKYWLTASGVLQRSPTKSELTELGELLLKYDPYLESSFSWFLIHYNLVTNYNEAPIFNMFFNLKIKTRFEKDDIYNALIEQLKENGEDIKDSYVFDDFNVFLKSYTVENNEVCLDEHTVDHLIIFMALAKGTSKIKFGPISLHTQTAIEIIKKFNNDINFKIIPGGDKKYVTNVIEVEGMGY